MKDVKLENRPWMPEEHIDKEKEPMKPCPHCNGSGISVKFSLAHGIIVDCPHCGGTGDADYIKNLGSIDE
jgi:DnaJ-class molecular chaperone